MTNQIIVPSTEALRAFCVVCREQGVTRIRSGELEITFGPLPYTPPTPPSTSTTEPSPPRDDFDPDQFAASGLIPPNLAAQLEGDA